MGDRIILNQQAISAAIADSRTKCSIQIDFDFLGKLLHILRPFEEFTQLLSSRNASISMVLPVFYALKHHLSTVDTGLDELQDFKNVVLRGLESRMESFLNKK
jgi:hypothetical protein